MTCVESLCPWQSILNNRWVPAGFGGLAPFDLDHSLEYTTAVRTKHLHPLKCTSDRAVSGPRPDHITSNGRPKKGIFMCWIGGVRSVNVCNYKSLVPPRTNTSPALTNPTKWKFCTVENSFNFVKLFYEKKKPCSGCQNNIRQLVGFCLEFVWAGNLFFARYIFELHRAVWDPGSFQIANKKR